jgi:hypothetical protein
VTAARWGARPALAAPSVANSRQEFSAGYEERVKKYFSLKMSEGVSSNQVSFFASPSKGVFRRSHFFILLFAFSRRISG